MKKYKFDIDLGHYIVLNEDEQQQDSSSNTAVSNNATQNFKPIPSLNTEEVAELNNKMSKEMQQFDKDIANLNNTKVQLEDTIAKLTEQYNNNNNTNIEGIRNAIIENNNKLLQVQLDIAKKEKDKADKKFTYISNILQVQKKVNETFIRKLPEKYKYLNESNIHTAKVYMNNLVGNEDNMLMKGMTDFKHAFGETDLLYGKDKNGYFIICIDQEDFNKCYNVLSSVGYQRDIIIDSIMPQLFDRTEMIFK